MKGAVEAILKDIRATDIHFEGPTGAPSDASYHPGRCARILVDGREVGVFGQIHPLVAQNYGVDAEFYCAELSMDELDGILITHEHTDHISGLATLIKHHSIPLYTSPGTARQLAYRLAGVEPLLRPRDPGTEFCIGSCRVTAFATSHDAAQSMDYRIDGSGSVGILTDTGYVTDEAAQVLPGVSLLVLESNHDVEYLRSGPYPYTLKQRILGSQGHLSNDDAAAFAAQMAAAGTRCIVLAHLSRENNTPQLAYDAVDRALRAGGVQVRLYVAPRDELSPAYETEGTPCRR